MSINLKAFMKPELKEDKTMEFDGIEAYKDEKGKPIPFIVKCLSRKQLNEIRDRYRTTTVYRDKKNGNQPVLTRDGQVAVMKDYDSEKAGLAIMVEAFVQPKLDDQELMDFYGVLDRLDMPEIIFNQADDFKYANDCVMIACGLKNQEDERDEVEELKN